MSRLTTLKRRIKHGLLLLGVAIGLCACYVVEVQQGNLIDADKVQQLKIGMSKEQVRYLMGAPVLESAFNDDRWDYVYTLRDRKRHYHYQHVGLEFRNDTLSRIKHR